MIERIGHLKVEIFKIKNRKGYAAVCFDHLTEGSSAHEAYKRMVKALRRSNNKDLTFNENNV
ncbi:MAG: hypothetical protein KJ710_04940 [Candidatus Omnitrophica bacterium]|nr:hypothetical protein [Candidatus Omnitrophota bacterium]MBU1923585.1 hypothetical protein [Candidatus Omnitrophota bacterium]